MTDLELAATLHDAIAILRTSAPDALPQTRAALRALAALAGPRPVVVRLSAIHEPVPSNQPRSMEPVVSPELAHRVVRVLAAGPQLGETIDAAFRRKEHDLGVLFAELSAFDARALHRRLSQPASGDMLSIQFSRLSAERRQRLLAFLGDARRRDALKGVAA